MNKIQRSEIIFSLSDDIYFNSENYFSKLFLEGIAPYKIFTGVGLAVTVENARFEHETIYLKNEKSLQRIKTKKEIILIEECFYAYVVKQNQSEIIFNYKEI